MDGKGQRGQHGINMVLISGLGLDVLNMSDKDPCVVCLADVVTNSILYDITFQLASHSLSPSMYWTAKTSRWQINGRGHNGKGELAGDAILRIPWDCLSSMASACSFPSQDAVLR